MVKYIICATRKAGLSREEFSAYWRNHHGPLVRSVPEFARHVRKYVQCHLVGDEVPLGAAGPHDGVAELWFDSVEDLQASLGTAEGQAAAGDVANFASGGATLMIAEA